MDSRVWNVSPFFEIRVWGRKGSLFPYWYASDMWIYRWVNVRIRDMLICFRTGEQSKVMMSSCDAFRKLDASFTVVF